MIDIKVTNRSRLDSEQSESSTVLKLELDIFRRNGCLDPVGNC